MFDVHRAGELAELGRSVAERALPGLRDALRRASVPEHREAS
jgi:hypothetical protein